MNKLNNKYNKKYIPYLSVGRVKGQYGVFEYFIMLQDNIEIDTTHPNTISVSSYTPEGPIRPIYKTIMSIEGYIKYRNYNKKMFNSQIEKQGNNDITTPYNKLQTTIGTESSILALLLYLKNYRLVDNRIGPYTLKSFEQKLKTHYYKLNCKLIKDIAIKYDLIIRALLEKHTNIDLNQIDDLVEYLLNEDTHLIGLSTMINLENIIPDNEYNQLITLIYQDFKGVHKKALVELKKFKALNSEFRAPNDIISNLNADGIIIYTN